MSSKAMDGTSKYLLIGILLLGLGSLAPAQGRFLIDVESGASFSGYNDIRIPGDSGTFFSLSRELKSETVPFLRARFGLRLGERHLLSLLAAPLRVRSEGRLDKDLRYLNDTFPSGADLSARYRFDSYRLTYRWQALKQEKLSLGLGFTAKIRDASITVEGAGRRAEKKNTGFVPIINFNLTWHPDRKWSLVFEGDALAAPQGRAEDVFLGAAYDISRHMALKAGYRILEGGADNDEVYTFSLFHYAVIGATIRL